MLAQTIIQTCCLNVCFTFVFHFALKRINFNNTNTHTQTHTHIQTSVDKTGKVWICKLCVITEFIILLIPMPGQKIEKKYCVIFENYKMFYFIICLYTH